MIKFFFLFLVLAFSHIVKSETTDGKITIGLNSHPKSGGVAAEIAKGLYFWGKKGEKNYRYGYVRPYVVGATSISVNQGEVGLQIFPISIFGVSFSHRVSSRSKDFDGLPCSTNNCLSDVKTNSLRTHFILGYEKWFLLYNTQFAATENLDQTRNYIDEGTMLVNAASGDHYFYSDLTFGYRLNSALSLGVNFSDAKIRHSEDSNLMRSVFVSYSQKVEAEHNYIFGVGYYESSVQARDITIYGIFRILLGNSLDVTR